MDEPVIDEQGRTEPPETGDEVATLVGFLEFHRATFRWKVDGLDTAGLRATHPPSTMTLGGMLKHSALVEDHWFSRVLHGREAAPPFADVDWDADPDWEWHTAADDAPETLLALWEATVERSRADVQQVLDAGRGLDAVAARIRPNGTTPTLRWILVHMIEEYARHNGHADLLREAIDGATGE